MNMPSAGRLSLRPAPAFLAALDSSMMRRSSYVQLVDKGIVREWNDSPALDSDMIAALPPPSLPNTNKPAQGRLHSSGVFPVPMPSFWNGSPRVSNVMVQPSGPDGGWHVERGSADFVEGAYNALEDDHSSPYFKIYFNGKEHTNYWGVDPRVGPVLVSVAPTGSSGSKTVIETVATFRSSARLVMNTHKKFSFNSESRNIVVHRCLIQSKHPEIQDMKFQKSVIDITDDLLRMERSHFSFDYKFGVLYYKKNQGENEMFSNSTSPELEKFLNFLGDRITLKGWPGFTGGLDVKNDTTGTHSVFTLFRDLNVMFHVCTLLPYNPKDPQQLERKRHIGNDIVVVVFVEPGATFDPCMMKTQFNHIYAVVSMDPGDQTVRLEFAVKQGVRPFGPQLLANQRFSLDASFREFFFSKLINSERSALKANVFAAKLEHTRLRMIESTIEKLQKTK
ncbi:GTPase activating Rap/RanGAP domainlike 3, putative [Acanthamoeba castellanii str. Neff]|uniref:GTPase activating Rap/RanGAP domainlike 3, putative n=1 Tax=Acanthamoeba castellanii (strain ATCC 30010 / Neff) TaxID=1257118 RepID=L8H9P3_ACACF|nr:GTPase activating Rap/RanGAP domainlike 3, putative [Acanthamoeba castellanii str. Neff]ELR21448.1 GTPase activating Rap/RanGAP domainlike 3, putative [Acanthamoeba castellanii str. Neff]